MRLKSFTVVATLMILCMSLSLGARPRDPRRERARCDSNLRLCNDVADADRRDCIKARTGHCDENHQEDVDQCNTDHKTCLDRIR